MVLRAYGYKDIIAYEQWAAHGGWIYLWILYGSPLRFSEEFYTCNPPVPYTWIHGGSTGNYYFKFATGDINADGYDDIVCGHFSTSVTSRTFDIFIIYGSPDLSNITELDFRSPPSNIKVSRIYSTNMSNYMFLNGDIAVGDLNGDRYDDVVVSEMGNNYNFSGKLYIIYGSKNGIPDVHIENPPSNCTIIYGSDPEDYMFGSSEVMDVNGDGKNDLVFVLPWDGFNDDRKYAGRTLILYNTYQGFPEVIDPENPPQNSTIIYGKEEGNGISGIYIEKINADNYNDLIIKCNSVKGGIIILYGGINGFPKVIDLLYPPENLTRIYSSGEYDYSLGLSVSYGYANNDKEKDLLISGVYFYDYETIYGHIWVLYGPLQNLPSEVDISSPPEGLEIVSYMGGYNRDYFGWDAKLSDINNDGIDEMIFSTYENSTIFVFYWSLFKF